MHENDNQTLKPKPEPEVLTKTEARQGETGHHVRLVLAVSLMGVIIAFIALGIAYFA